MTIFEQFSLLKKGDLVIVDYNRLHHLTAKIRDLSIYSLLEKIIL